jgi:hypothetical protein
MLPKEKRVALSDGMAVSILHAVTHPAMGERDAERGRKPTPSNKIRIARFAKIPPRSESLVELQCDAPGLRFLQYSLRPSSTRILGCAGARGERVFYGKVATQRDGPWSRFAAPTGIVSLVEQEVDRAPPAKSVPKGLKIALSPEKYAMGMEPPALPYRPDV